MAKDKKAVGIVVGSGQDLELAIAGQRPGEVNNLTFAVTSDAPRDRRSGEPGTDHGSNIGRRRSFGDVQAFAVGQCDLQNQLSNTTFKAGYLPPDAQGNPAQAFARRRGYPRLPLARRHLA